MIHISEDDVRRLLPMPEAVRLVRETFAEWRAGRAVNQIRRRLTLANGAGLHSMAGAVGKYFGTKFYSTSPSGYAFHFMLYSAETAQPLALFEANWLGQIRTGATSGVATDLLANPNAKTLAVIGTGFQAASQIDAIRTVRPSITEVRQWSRSKQINCASAEDCVRGADVISTATWAKDPVLENGWVQDGAHVNAIGSNYRTKREVPKELIDRAGVIVADSIEACQDEAGDLLMADVDWSRVVELKDLDRSWNPNAVTIFKSVGLCVEDVAVAGYVYERLLFG
ncbi:MAG: ornithine cyclodeaminase family protein [Bryobacteraceae bacterium]|nr:ornithine cyclodeaminase family protein [Bryobacteraceae bacterium]